MLKGIDKKRKRLLQGGNTKRSQLKSTGARYARKYSKMKKLCKIICKAKNIKITTINSKKLSN